MEQERVKRYEQSIYQSLVVDPEPVSTIGRLREQLADPTWGSLEWRAATQQAITKFEAR